jgi:hypothetical protein
VTESPAQELPVKVLTDSDARGIALGLVQAWTDQDIVTCKHLLLAAEEHGTRAVLQRQLELVADQQLHFSADLPETRLYEGLVLAHATGLPEAFDQLWPADVDGQLRLLIVGSQLLQLLSAAGRVALPHVQFARWTES